MSGVSVSVKDAIDPLVLAIDAGTSSVRALVYDARARAVQSLEVHRPYEVTTTADGGVYAGADSLVSLVTACLDELVRHVTAAGRQIAAVGCDTFWHSLMGVDAESRAATPVFTWADTRSAAQAAELRRRVDEAAVHARTGTVIHSSYWPAKLLWLRQTQPETVARVRHWISFAEYLYHHLFGRLTVSLSMASGTGLFDQNTCSWDSEMVEAAGIHDRVLSPLSEYSTALSRPRAMYSSRWPELRAVPWYLPVGDGAANNVGAGGASADRAVVMVGTSGALRVVREAAAVRIPKGVWTYRVDRRRVVQGGALSAGGNIFAWALKSLKLDAADMLETEVAALPPDGHGLTVLPFLAGERSPDWNVDARSAIVGITLDTSAPELVRALLEAVSYRFGLVYDMLRQEIPSVRGIIGSGAGLLHSPTWIQMMADVFGQPVTVCAVPEASSRGTALLVLECLGAIRNSAEVPAEMGTTYAPEKANTDIYRAALERQQELYERLLPSGSRPDSHRPHPPA